MKHGLTQMIGGRGGFIEQMPKEISKWPRRMAFCLCTADGHCGRANVPKVHMALNKIRVYLCFIGG
jgi:hypothetical protein